jgi:leucyl/phenylalanyl-tRNA--protein transferase
MTTVPWLDPEINSFPPVEQALDEPNGLLAAGGDLSANRLIEAYRRGIFPWYESPQPILWWSPSPRMVLFPDRVHVSRSLQKRLKRQEYQLSFDRAFEQVINNCSRVERAGQDDTWIGGEMIAAYQQLHELGYAHSVEAWYEGELVGGLYGIAIGRVFFGESMFSLRSDASKVAFVHLARHLQDWDVALIVGLAVAINLMVAALAGVIVPLVLNRLKIDPALAGGVVLTTVTDVVGFFSFLGLGTLLLM